MDSRTLDTLRKIEEAMMDTPTMTRIEADIVLDINDEPPNGYAYVTDAIGGEMKLYTKVVGTNNEGRPNKEINVWIPA